MRIKVYAFIEGITYDYRVLLLIIDLYRQFIVLISTVYYRPLLL